MAPASRHLILTRIVLSIGLLLVIGLVALLSLVWRRMPDVTTATENQAPAVQGFMATPAVVTGHVWDAMVGAVASGAGPGETARGNQRFRLAGTFSVEAPDGQAQRKAIVDDVPRHEQHIVGEGDTVADARVERIYYDHVTIRIGAVSEDVWLEFGRSHGQGTASIETNAALAAEGALATNRFGGVQLQPDRWQFGRQGLLNYYQELLDEPDRMVAVFDSMKPVRNADNKITGYVVGIEGEADFFQAAGLRNGDIVRKVNSVPMTSRRRAEFFIDEFLKDRANVVVLDVERDGATSRQVYLIRP